RGRESQTRRLGAGIVALGPAPERRRPQGVGAARQPVARGVTAGDCDARKDGKEARLAAAPDWMERHAEARGQGRFRFAHGNPTSSPPGLSAVPAEYYAVTGKLAGLTIDDVNHARRDVRKIEQSIVHYAPTADDLLAQLARYGPGYASAVVVQETSLVQFNEQSPRRLVAIYPADGTFMADYPYIALAVLGLAPTSGSPRKHSGGGSAPR